MAGLAIETLAQVLTDYGPPILATMFRHPGGAAELRLQKEGDSLHDGTHDPHKEGRALDIVLLSWLPGERSEADKLVRLFLDQSEDMRWGWLIYNRKQWGPDGAETPRIFTDAQRPNESDADFAMRRIRHEHLTHIHIEWIMEQKNFNTYKNGLIASLSEDLDEIAELDALSDKLAGTWDVTIGNGAWVGVFKFTSGGRASWHDSRSAPAGGIGNWNADTPGKLRWTFGDARTFDADLPIDPKGVSGVALPAGSGWYRMVKGPP
jgi:hypothetical protein